MLLTVVVLVVATFFRRFTHRLDKYSRIPPPLPWSNDYHDFADQFGGLCLTPAFRGPPSHLLNSYRFPNIPVKHFAEQLTRMDMELFKRLIPHQCLGAIWSNRDKHECSSVLATVTQFNAVSFRVISSILIEPRLKPQERALLISTWIDIAQELRLLKNFSSLKAIISGLQSNAVYRLSKTWAVLPRDKVRIWAWENQFDGCYLTWLLFPLFSWSCTTSWHEYSPKTTMRGPSERC